MRELDVDNDTIDKLQMAEGQKGLMCNKFTYSGPMNVDNDIKIYGRCLLVKMVSDSLLLRVDNDI